MSLVIKCRKWIPDPPNPHLCTLKVKDRCNICDKSYCAKHLGRHDCRPKTVPRQIIYKIVQYRDIGNGLEEKGFTIDETYRIKQARGLLKQHFDSHVEMLQKHDLMLPDFNYEVGPDSISISFFEDGKRVYRYLVRIEPDAA